MKLNKKGFAISSIVYTILILFLVLIFSVLSILGGRKLMLDKTKKDIMDKLNGDVVDSGEKPEVSVKPLIDEILKQYNESNTVGLLKDETGYYYKGSNTEVANNYVWWAGHLWRVVSIDNDNNITMITQQSLTSIQPASTGWTTQTAYEASYINHWLNSEEDGVFYKSLIQEDKDKILNSIFNVGIYYNVSEFTTTQKVGLLDRTQYVKAGGQNSFLDIKNAWWLGGRQDGSNGSAINQNGASAYFTLSSPLGVRPVVKISNLTFSEGAGTLSDPYRESSRTTFTSDIKVGEYISIPTTGNDCGTDKKCLFKVVSKDSDSIKVTLNGILASTSTFGSTTTYTSGNTVDVKIKAFANTINSAYRYDGNKAFGIGVYGDRANYTAVQNTTYTGTNTNPVNVGLPVVGEMFSGNMGSHELNINVAQFYWIMNAYTTSYVRVVASGSSISASAPTDANGVRPVLFLKNDLTFTGGEGTAESPFTLD